MRLTGKPGWKSTRGCRGGCSSPAPAHGPDMPHAPLLEIPRKLNPALNSPMLSFLFLLHLPRGNLNPFFPPTPIHHVHKKTDFPSALLQLSPHLKIVIMSSPKCSFFRINNPNSFNLCSGVRFCRALINSVALLEVHYTG